MRVRALAHGAGSGALLPAPDAPASAFRDALAGARHLVHAAARNNTDGRAGSEGYFGPNVLLSAKLAAAAAEALPGRTIFLSSIRAVVGPRWSGEIHDGTPPAPACPYGCSKRDAELAFLAAFAGAPERLGILRLAPVYGPGMKGNLGALLRLADTPWPLPLAGLPGRRSLLGREAAASAVLHLLRVPAMPGPPVLASDLAAVSPAEIVSAFRAGLARPRRLLPFPHAAAGKALHALGKGAAWDALTATQTCRPERLVESGWAPLPESLPGLAAAAARRPAG